MNQLLVDLINKNKYKIGVEVGVRHGDTSKRVLDLEGPKIESSYFLEGK